MRSRALAACATIAGSSLALGPACSDREPGSEPRFASQPIIGGTPDTLHSAVLALVNPTGSCSGTVIASRGDSGYFLTAAHCLSRLTNTGELALPVQPLAPENVALVPGLDWSEGLASSAYYPVVELALHPGYPGDAAFDVAMARFVGADDALATTPAMTAAEDDLADGVAVTLVGYGQTEDDAQNTVRYRVDTTVSDLGEAGLVLYDESNDRGSCNGDSGGPVLRATASGERVAAVISFGSSATCAVEFGGGPRVSTPATQSFIEDFVAAAPPPRSCTDCLLVNLTSFGACPDQAVACGSGSECEAYSLCRNRCAGGSSCVAACATAYPEGAVEDAALFSCACDTGCEVECAGFAGCNPSSCGFAVGENPCNACMQQSCCDPIGDCNEDAQCLTCAFAAARPAACQESEPFFELRECLVRECASDCEVPSCGFTNTGACGQCLNDCCAQGQSCYADDVCFDCALGGGFVNVCEANQHYRDLFACLGDCAGDPCGALSEPPDDPPTTDDPEAEGGAAGTDDSGAAAGAGGERTTPRGAAGAAGEASAGGSAGSASDETKDVPRDGGSGCACRITPDRRTNTPAWPWLGTLLVLPRFARLRRRTYRQMQL
jgi:hypothetical protein